MDEVTHNNTDNNNNLYNEELPTVISTVGGEGTRLYPLTLAQPKPLVSLCNRAILRMMFEDLAFQGCSDFILAQKGFENSVRLKDYFQDGESFSKCLGINNGKKLCIRMQPKYNDHGSADAVKHCMNYYNIDKSILVVSGDNVLDINIHDLIKFHNENDALLTIALTEVKDTNDFGIADIGPDNRIKKFVEKPKPEDAPSHFANTAVYLFSSEIRDILNKMDTKNGDFGNDVIPYLTENGYKVFGYIISGYWNDVGNPSRYLESTYDILRNKVKHVRFHTERVGERRWMDMSTKERIEKKWKEGRIFVGDYTYFGANCEVGEDVKIENSVVGDNCIIGKGARISDSVLMDFAIVGEGAILNSTIVGRYTTIESTENEPTTLHAGSVVGENIELPKGTTLGPKERVCPLRYSHKVMSTGKFKELGDNGHNFYFSEM